jgi:hypothetical protein
MDKYKNIFDGRFVDDNLEEIKDVSAFKAPNMSARSSEKNFSMKSNNNDGSNR